MLPSIIASTIGSIGCKESQRLYLRSRQLFCSNADFMFGGKEGIRSTHCFAHVAICRAPRYKCLSMLFSSLGYLYLRI